MRMRSANKHTENKEGESKTVSTTARLDIALLITSHMKRRDAGSIPVLGSSRYTTFGFAISATVTLSLRLLPPEYVPASLSAYGTSDIRLSMSARRLV